MIEFDRIKSAAVIRVQDMSEAFNRLPPKAKIASGVTSAAVALSLAGCQVAQMVNSTREPTTDNGTHIFEVSPTALQPIEGLIPTQENFQATKVSPLKGEIKSLSGEGLKTSDLNHFQTKITDAIRISPYARDIAAIPENEQNILGQQLEDEYGNKQLVIVLAHQVGGKIEPITIHTRSGDSVQIPFFFYADSRGYLFAPPDYGSPAEPGRLLPVGYWQEGGKGYFGFGYESNQEGKYTFQSTVPLIEVDSSAKETTYIDPFSGKSISWKSTEIPAESVISQVETISFTQPQFLPTQTPEIPTPSVTSTPEATATATEAPVPLDLFKINYDLTKPSELPTDDLNRFTTPEFGKWVMAADAAGLFPEVPETSEPIQFVTPVSEKEIQLNSDYGNVVMFRLGESKYLNLSKRPWVVAGGWKVTYEGEHIYLVLMKYENKNKSHGFWGYLFNPPPGYPGQALQYAFPGSNSAYYPTAFYLMPKHTLNGQVVDGCANYFKIYGYRPNTKFCQWYYQPHISGYTYPKDILDAWQATGILTNKDDNGDFIIPITPAYAGARAG